VFYTLSYTHCVLHIVFYTLCFTYCVLHIVSYTFCSTHYILHIVFYTLCSTHCFLHIVFYTLWSTHCILCIVFYALYYMHCILCIVFYLLYCICAVPKMEIGSGKYYPRDCMTINQIFVKSVVNCEYMIQHNINCFTQAMVYQNKTRNSLGWIRNQSFNLF
jgi:hypothetical protein